VVGIARRIDRPVGHTFVGADTHPRSQGPAQAGVEQFRRFIELFVGLIVLNESVLIRQPVIVLGEPVEQLILFDEFVVIDEATRHDDPKATSVGR